MIEIGYITLGFVLGVVFTLTALLSVGRWLNRSSGLPSPPPMEIPKQQGKTTKTMWDK